MSGFTDLGQLLWLPPRLRPYARLMRLDRPIGTWLLLLPGWWALALYGAGVELFLLFGVGAVLLRGAGCIINDLWDRRIDQQVERTRGRPLASGEVSVLQALGLLAFILILGLLILLQFNLFAMLVGAASLLLVVIYPLMKRFMWWPQAVLGLTFNWGVLLGTAVVTGGVTGAAMVLYAAGVAWTLAYDTLYAHQDKADDAKVGVKSLALRLGGQSRPYVAGFFVLCLGLLALAGEMADLSVLYFVGLLVAAGHAFWQLRTWQPDIPGSCLACFRSNRDFGLIVLAAIFMGRMI